MKKLFSKWLTMVLTICMAASVFPAVTAFAEEAEVTDRIVIDAASNVPMYDYTGSKRYAETTDEVSYGANEVAVDWRDFNAYVTYGTTNVRKHEALYSENYNGDNSFKDYDTVNLRIYSHKSTQQKFRIWIKYTVMVNGALGTSSTSSTDFPSGVGYYHHYFSYDILGDWTGWKTISVPVADFYDRASAGNHSWENGDVYVEYVSLTAASFKSGENYDETAAFGVDRLWFSKQTEDNSKYMLADYSTPSIIKDTTKSDKARSNATWNPDNNPNPFRVYEYTTENTLNGAQSALEWSEFTNTPDAYGDSRSRTALYTNVETTKKIDDFKYVNMWLYSKSNNGQKFRFNITNTTAPTKLLYNKNVTVNWQGWKLLSFEISKMDKWNKDYPELWEAAANSWLVGINLSYSTNTILEDTAFAVDSVWMSNYSPVSFAGTCSIETGSENVPAKKKTIAFTLDNKIAETQPEDAIIVTKNKAAAAGEADEKVSFTTQIVDNVLYVKLDEYMDFDTNYYVCADGLISSDRVTLSEKIESNFKTAAECVNIGSYKFTPGSNAEAGDYLDVTVDIENLSASEENAVLILAGYDEHDRMVEVALSSPLTVMPYKNGTAKTTIIMPTGYTALNCKAFLMEDADSFAPVKESIDYTWDTLSEVPNT